jgi:hypothetical protein
MGVASERCRSSLAVVTESAELRPCPAHPRVTNRLSSRDSPHQPITVSHRPPSSSSSHSILSTLSPCTNVVYLPWALISTDLLDPVLPSLSILRLSFHVLVILYAHGLITPSFVVTFIHPRPSTQRAPT